MAEIRRVLRPGGELRVIELVAADGGLEQRLQRALAPVWTWIEDSCHVDHETNTALAAAGFDVSTVEARLQDGQPLLFRTVVEGTATAP